jgi:prepilin-type N-terminal cleavage/methylation domain-containing protein
MNKEGLVRGLRNAGFTLLEILLVSVIVGALLAVIVPRAFRANQEAKFGQVRQSASEIASYMTQWVQIQAAAQTEGSPYTLKDVFSEYLDPAISGITNVPLLNRYTGSEAFDGVEKLVPPETRPKNPFNETSYFEPINNDAVVLLDKNKMPVGATRFNEAVYKETPVAPSRKPGMLYFVSAKDLSGKENYRYFFLIYTDVPRGGRQDVGTWYGQMNDQDPDAIKRGIFVARYPDTKMVENMMYDRDLGMLR